MGQVRLSVRHIHVPPIYISPTCGSTVAGRWNGLAIHLCEEHQAIKRHRNWVKVSGEKPYSIRNELRAIVLHEVRHALDHHALGLVKEMGAVEDLEGDHNAAWHRRLKKLENLFPPEGA